MSVLSKLKQMARIREESMRLGNKVIAKSNHNQRIGKMEESDNQYRSAQQHYRIFLSMKDRLRKALGSDDTHNLEKSWCASKKGGKKWGDWECFDIFWGSDKNEAAPIPGYREIINSLPTEEKIMMDPILYADHETPAVREYARQLIQGD